MQGSVSAMLELATIEPVWTRAAIPLLGVVAFGAVATIGQRRATTTPSLFVLTGLMGFWLLGAALVWRKRWPSMVRWNSAWAGDPGSWPWTALFVVAVMGVLFVALALRSFSAGRRRAGWVRAGGAFSLFVLWSAVVKVPVGLALVPAIVALAALRADANFTPPATAVRPPARGLVIAAVTALVGFWLVVAFVWWVAREGENVQCGCWADDRYAWQYTGQFLLAIAGSIGLIEAAVAYGRRAPGLALPRCLLVTVALGGWVALLVSALPPGREVSLATTRPPIRQALLVHRSDAARAAGGEPAPDRSG